MGQVELTNQPEMAKTRGSAIVLHEGNFHICKQTHEYNELEKARDAL